MIVQWFLHYIYTVYTHIPTQSPSYFGLILIGREMRLCVCVCVCLGLAKVSARSFCLFGFTRIHRGFETSIYIYRHRMRFQQTILWLPFRGSVIEAERWKRTRFSSAQFVYNVICWHLYWDIGALHLMRVYIYIFVYCIHIYILFFRGNGRLFSVLSVFHTFGPFALVRQIRCCFAHLPTYLPIVTGQ